LAVAGLLGFFALQGAPAIAQDPSIHAVPSSILIFPLFDSTPDKGTLITVTNTNTSTVSCGNSYKAGDICVHYIYVNKDDDEEECDEFDRFECLTPGDTLTVIADQHNPQQLDGWLWVEARDPETLLPITYDFLIGSAIIVESALEFVWSYTPYSFKSRVTSCTQPGGGTDCGSTRRCFTDLDGDEDADFGIEYEFFPDDLLLDQFFEEGSVKNIMNELTLMSVRQIGSTSVTALIWNNNEVRFSRGFVFDCHSRAPLSTISNLVRDLGGVEDDHEKFQTGWIEFQSSVGILGVFKHQRKNFGEGNELFTEGTQSVSIDRF
jgi:hypothetical protein